MVKDQSRRKFFRTVPLAAAAGLTLTNRLLAAASSYSPDPQDAQSPGQESPQLFPAQTLESIVKTLQGTPGNKQLSGSKDTPFTIVVTVENNKAAKEFEYHQHRDHIFQVIEGTTQYELGGTPQTPRSTGPGEWLAPQSTGSKSYTLNKGDMLVIPRGMPHKRSTAESVTFTLISVQDIPHA